eukprot:CAMPEP_0180270210 /NCGR_PEP_ID=MMETSP0988-20121125/3065_1 /TAXON_ID=697907 /ORGANISM="non described non described, Strain CCMP2293" /LENGTH=344 /DNA_ID=CAMNT_0022241149 /DNA_START=40 /DNA_END=1074 /DNA_ORIENTATION=-
MTVLRLADGSLMVKDPIAPTGECLAMLKSLGEVRHIVLGSTALEHKVFCRAFVDKFPEASFYAPPGLFNYLPGYSDFTPRGLGLLVDLVRPVRITGYLTPGFAAASLNGVDYPASERPGWADEVSHELLFFDAPIANAAEVAFFHKRTRSLLVTDSVTYINSTSEDWMTRRGMRDRSFPLNLYPKEWSPARKKATDMMQVLTVQTPYKDEDLAALTDKLYVCPQLRLFVFETDPALVLEWVARVSKWDFARVIPSHFDVAEGASRRDFQDAFSFISDRKGSGQLAPLPGDHALGVQKLVQVILRRTLFKERLEAGRMTPLEYAQEEDGEYRGRVWLPLLGDVRI